MKCFTVDLLNEALVEGLATEILNTKASSYPIVRYANPTLIYLADKVIDSIDPETGLINQVNIIRARNGRLLLIPETESEDALILITNSPVSNIFTGEEKTEDCPYQNKLVWLRDCPLCGVPCIDRIRVPQIMTKVDIANLGDYKSRDDYPRYVHFKKGEIKNYPTFKEGEEENGITLFDIKEENYYNKGSYIGNGCFSVIIKMKPGSSITVRNARYSNSKFSVAWDGDKLK